MSSSSGPVFSASHKLPKAPKLAAAVPLIFKNLRLLNLPNTRRFLEIAQSQIGGPYGWAKPTG
jgi:hypothetical protein